MIEGASIRLRAWQERDLYLLQTLRNDVVLQAQLLAHARGSDVEQVRTWLHRRSNGADCLFFVVANQGDDAALGFIQFLGVDSTDRRADLGICLARDAQGRGTGTEAITLALPHLVQTFGTRKVNLQVRADLERAIRCYERMGFQRCGLYRKHFGSGDEWHDVLLMELLL